MELITLQSEVWKRLQKQIDTIQAYFENLETQQYNDVWLNHHEVCVYLHISSRTLNRMRKAGELTYSKNRRQYFYTIRDIQSLLDSYKIESKEHYLKTLNLRAKHYLKQ